VSAKLVEYYLYRCSLYDACPVVYVIVLHNFTWLVKCHVEVISLCHRSWSLRLLSLSQVSSHFKRSCHFVLICGIHYRFVKTSNEHVSSGASQISDKPYRWQVNSVTVNSVTSNQWHVSVSSVTVIIYRQTTFSDPTSRICLHLEKFIVENNFQNYFSYILAGVPAALVLFRW